MLVVIDDSRVALELLELEVGMRPGIPTKPL